MAEPDGGAAGSATPHPASVIGRAWASYALAVVSADPVSEIALKRAISTAYFALFHAVTLRASDLRATDAAPGESYELVRDFQHRDLHRVALWVAGSGTPPARWASGVAALRGDEQVGAVVQAALLLRKARLDADYDHRAAFSRNRALVLVEAASGAVDVVASDAFATGTAGRRFLQLVADQPGPRP